MDGRPYRRELPPAIYIANVKRLFDDGGELTDEKTGERLGGFLAAFAAWIERTAETSL